MTDDAMRKGSTPMSSRRVNTPAAAPLWIVLMTRCPVRPAWIATRAVSGSRISPNTITSGSWRNTARRAASNVKPEWGLTSV